MKPSPKFWRIEPAGDGSGIANVFIFGQISGDLPGVARMFANELDALPETTKKLKIRINSPGGEVFIAQAIYSILSGYHAQKVVYLGNFIAGAATLIASVGQPVIATKNLKWVNSSPKIVVAVQVSPEEMRALETIMEPAISVYMNKTGRTRQEIRALIEAEKEMSANEALEFGFVDEIIMSRARTQGLN